MTSALLNDLDKIINQVSTLDSRDKKLFAFYSQMGNPNALNKHLNMTMVVFDLSESTALKISLGHNEAMRKIRIYDRICRSIVKRFDGEIIKPMGDGILAAFENPLNACLAALNVQEVTMKLNIVGKSALVLGVIEKAMTGDTVDIFGTAVDICARIEKLAVGNQIIIDNTLYNVAKTFLKNYDDVIIGEPIPTVLKGYGQNEVHEISTKTSGLRNKIVVPFYINEKGRMTIQEKLGFFHNARSEIIEIGIGLSEFTNYLTQHHPSEFKNPVKDLLKKGINIKCVLADPDYMFKIAKLRNDIDIEYQTRVSNNLIKLKEAKSEFDTEQLSGSFQIFVSKELSLFHATCIDLNDEWGKMITSNYLPNIAKSMCPSMIFSQQSNPILYNTYTLSINHLLKNSTPL
jgi:hypothetical protein